MASIVTINGKEMKMKGVNENVVFHFSNHSSQSTIQKEGLRGGVGSTFELLSTSSFMDAHRTHNVPKWFYRTTSVYTYPEMDYCIGEDDEPSEVFEDSDLWAIDISNMEWFIGSIGLSGFCLGSARTLDDPEFDEKEHLKWTRLYWHNFFSKDEFLNQSKLVQKANEDWGLDEVLIPLGIRPEKILYLGSNKQGIFIPKMSNIKKIQL